MNPLERRVTRRRALIGAALGAAGLSAAAVLGCGSNNSENKPLESSSKNKASVSSTPDNKSSSSAHTTGPETPIIEGWTRFRSLNYPYEIQYPHEWQTGATQLGETKIDVFTGDAVNGFQTNFNIYAKPIGNWVRIDDLLRGTIDELKQSYKGFFPVIFGAGETKISGQDAYIVFSSLIPKDLTMPNPNNAVYQEEAIFIFKDKAWYITRTKDASVKEDGKDGVSQEFRKILDSLKLLQ